ncbi:MAG: hypothetical protein ACXW1D_00330 [Halobacteriota archaeon]
MNNAKFDWLTVARKHGYAFPDARMQNFVAELLESRPAAPVVAEGLTDKIRLIADELAQEGANYDGDLADTVEGCAAALHDILAAHPIAGLSVPDCSPADPVDMVMQAIKDAPANIAKRTDTSPKGNMIGEFPAEPMPTHTVAGSVIPEYWMSIQHGELKVSYTDDSDPAYKWFPVARVGHPVAGLSVPDCSTAEAESGVIKGLRKMVEAYGPKSLQYDIEHPNDGLNSSDPKEVERVGRGIAAEPMPASEAPEGFALVPLKMSRAMRDVTDEEGWQWEDLLAAAEAITEEQYNEILAAPVPASEAANLPALLETLERADAQMIAKFAGKRLNIEGYRDWSVESMGAIRGAITILKRFAAPAAPTDKKG